MKGRGKRREDREKGISEGGNIDQWLPDEKRRERREAIW